MTGDSLLFSANFVISDVKDFGLSFMGEDYHIRLQRVKTYNVPWVTKISMNSSVISDEFNHEF